MDILVEEMLPQLLAWMAALVLTVVIEGAIVLAIFRKPRFLYYSFLMNLLTNPALNLCVFLAMTFFGVSYWVVVGIGELAVLVVEAILANKLMQLSWPRSLLLSLLTNATSMLAGIVLIAAFPHGFF